MNAQRTSQNALAETGTPLKLAALWASFMFFYIYVDYFHLLMPGKVSDILAGKVFVFDVTPVFLLTGLVSVSIPTLMISLSVVLPQTASRWTNLIVAAIYIPYSVFNLVGEVAWLHMVYGAVVEVVLLLLIIRMAWRWRQVSP